MKPHSILNASSVRFGFEVLIDAPPARVWQALVENVDEWWIADLRCVSASSRVTLDPRAGGRLIEADDSGASLLWFTVIAVEPGRSINFAGAMAPPFGGPSQAFLLVSLKSTDAGSTTVQVTHSIHGLIDESSLSATEGGWRMLFEQGLKPVAEGLHRAGS